MHSFIQLQESPHSGSGCSEAGAYPENTGHGVEFLGWETFIHTWHLAHLGYI